MKKFAALLLALIFSSLNGVFAFSEAYYLKNTTSSVIQPSVLDGFYNQNYKIISTKNPYYGKSQKDSQEYAVVILQQSGNNTYYYYQSNDNKKINKYIKKAIKRAGIEYEESSSPNIISTFDSIAQRTISSSESGTSTSNYVFNTDQPAYSNSYVSSGTKNSSNSNTYKGHVANIASGTKLNIYLQSAINTANATQGDRIIAVLTDDLKYNGYTIAPQGSLVYGILTKARPATYGSRNGRVVIDFNQLVTPDGKTFDISTEKIDFTVTNEGKIGRVASNVAVGAIAGALGGLIVGALSHNVGAATAIGAGIGAGGALIGGTAERGVDAEIPSFTEMEIILTKPFSATVSY